MAARPRSKPAKSEPGTGSRVREPGTGSRVRVQRVGRGFLLRVDGTYASLVRPGRVTTGSVWDALAAPIVALPPRRRRDVLVLGLGGGSVARLVRAIASEARIVGVELDPSVIEAARAHLGLDALGIEVVQADAERFLRSCRERFDLVVDDVFVKDARGLRKPDFLPRPGLALAASRLRRGGMLVTNVIAEAPVARAYLAERFGGSLELTLPDCTNRVIVASDALPSAMDFRAALAADAHLAPLLPRLRVRSRMA